MKKFIPFYLILALVFSSIQLSAQETETQRISPPKVYTQKLKKDKTVSINYSELTVRQRKIWGSLVPFDKIWRTGANEATIFEIDKDCKLNGKKLKAGKYSMFTIPRENGKWTVIINKVAHQWGAYEYDEREDALRFEASTKKNEELSEKLVFEISENGEFSMKWEYLELNFKIK